MSKGDVIGGKTSYHLEKADLLYSLVNLDLLDTGTCYINRYFYPMEDITSLWNSVLYRYICAYFTVHHLLIDRREFSVFFERAFFEGVKLGLLYSKAPGWRLPTFVQSQRTL